MNTWTTVVVSAAAGFELVAVSERGGTVCSVPVIAWAIVMSEGPVVAGLRPITCGFVEDDSRMAYAVKCPDGRIYAMLDYPHLSPGPTHTSVEEWAFSVRARACGHDLEGSA